FFFFQAEDGIRDFHVTGVQTCALPIYKLILGATYLRLSEQPLTVKSNYGDESVNNAIYGFNFNYSTDAPFLTRWVNKLPNIDTEIGRASCRERGKISGVAG